MSTTSNTLQERLAETRAAANAEMAVKILIELINEPNGKRFASNRGARQERWQQLADVANAQAGGLLAKPVVAKKRAPKLPTIPATGELVTAAQVAAANS